MTPTLFVVRVLLEAFIDVSKDIGPMLTKVGQRVVRET